jgi:hypothetical protein
MAGSTNHPTPTITDPSPFPIPPAPSRCGGRTTSTLIVIGYNMEPVVPGAGSAIFLHIATPDFAPTAGCVAVEREILLELLPLLGPGSRIAITG